MKRNNGNNCQTKISRHAFDRLEQRNIKAEAVEAVLDYGREVFTRGAVVHAIGQREIRLWAREGVDLSRYDGMQVTCSHDGNVITVYRNRNFRGLRGNLGRGRYNRVAHVQTA